MKYIQKAGCPHPYANWCASVDGTAKSDWRELGAAQKEPLLAALIAEQGALCAYTMRRIDSKSAHVEHIKPESVCRKEEPGSDLDYTNLVACYPRKGMLKRCRYGAPKKDKWWVNDGEEFISPLHPACEKRFRFDEEGAIAAVGNHPGALTTIGILALDHDSLTEDRRRAIKEFIYGPNGDEPLSRAEAVRASASVVVREGGEFYEFCIAIRHALEDYINRLDRQARRRDFARRQR